MKTTRHTNNGKTTYTIKLGWLGGFIFALFFIMVMCILFTGFFGFLIIFFGILAVYWLYCEIADFFFPRKNLAGIPYKRF